MAPYWCNSPTRIRSKTARQESGWRHPWLRIGVILLHGYGKKQHDTGEKREAAMSYARRKPWGLSCVLDRARKHPQRNMSCVLDRARKHPQRNMG